MKSQVLLKLSNPLLELGKMDEPDLRFEILAIQLSCKVALTIWSCGSSFFASETCRHADMQPKRGYAPAFPESETLAFPPLLGSRSGITWRIIAGDELPPQKWLHWFGQRVCVRECNSDRSQHFTNGPSKHLNKTLCVGRHCWGEHIRSQLSSKWLMHSVSVQSCAALHHPNKHINPSNSVCQHAQWLSC